MSHSGFQKQHRESSTILFKNPETETFHESINSTHSWSPSPPTLTCPQASRSKVDPAKQSPVKGAGGLVQVQKLMYALGRAKPLVRARVGASHSDGLLQWIWGGGRQTPEHLQK